MNEVLSRAIYLGFLEILYSWTKLLVFWLPLLLMLIFRCAFKRLQLLNKEINFLPLPAASH